MKERKGMFRMHFILIILVIAFMIPCIGMKAEAATTCKSVLSYPGTATAKVNMRKKAGTTYKSYGLVSKNAKVTILGYVTNKGTKWYKCKAKLNGKSKTGYISSAYIYKEAKPKGVVNSKVTTSLNVRKSAKTTAKSLLKITKNTKVTVLGITKKSNTNYWYKIKATKSGKTKTGYVLAKYITVNSTTTTSSDSTSNAKAGYVNNKVTTYLNVRQYANTTSTVLLRIPQKTVVSVLGTSGDWYKIKVTYGGKTVTGYASKTYITLGDISTNNSNTNANTAPTDVDFETSLTYFPESYKAGLRALHAEYPKWKFVAVNTGLDWGTVIANESVVGRNVIQSNYPNGTNSLAPFSYLSTASGAYDWSKDKYTVKDGTNWFCANSEVISYYMDPRNFLNSTDIFQFEALAYDAAQSSTVVQNILNNTFMKGNYSVVDSATKAKVSGSYTQAFMDAGKTALANPYFLASRSKQEVGVNGSNATSGTYKGYEGLYNFYNIGATDGGNAVAKGLNWANGGDAKATTYGRPWTNPYKSIVGGAQYIAKNYINVGQNTLYFQKFNVVYANYLYLHQYMTNVQAPSSEGRTTRAAYNSLGILGDQMAFYIPVYSNMPASACALPAATGNPNPYISSLNIYNGSNTSQKLQGLTPTFNYSVDTYTMVVPKAVTSVAISATPVSKRATVLGCGTIYLKDVGATTSIKITGRAENGATKEYTINIVRSAQ